MSSEKKTFPDSKARIKKLGDMAREDKTKEDKQENIIMCDDIPSSVISLAQARAYEYIDKDIPAAKARRDAAKTEMFIAEKDLKSNYFEVIDLAKFLNKYSPDALREGEDWWGELKITPDIATDKDCDNCEHRTFDINNECDVLRQFIQGIHKSLEDMSNGVVDNVFPNFLDDLASVIGKHCRLFKFKKDEE